MIEQILRNKNSQNIFWFLIGFGITILLFHRPIPTEYILPVDPQKINNQQIKFDGKCFLYRVEDVSCKLDSVK